MSFQENTDHIDHTGIVDFVDVKSGSIRVKIKGSGDCGDCPAAKLCEVSGQSDNVITIKTSSASSYNKGDIVTVRGTERMHRKAIMYATVIPSVALVAVMVAVYILTFNQLAAALSGIAVTILFYILIWASRNKIAHEFSFSLVGQPRQHKTGTTQPKLKQQ